MRRVETSASNSEDLERKVGADRTPGFRAPKQQRSRRTLTRIAEATESLLAERGPEELTVQDVIARANTSVGAFYVRFDSKADAVAYVQNRFWREIREAWAGFLSPDRWTGVPARALVAEVIRRLVRVLAARQDRTRAFLHELVRRPDDGLRGRLRSLDEQVSKDMARLLEARRAELCHPDPGAAAANGFLRVLGAARDAILLGGLEASSTRGAPRLISCLTQMYSGLLGIDDPPRSYRALLGLCAGIARPTAGSPGTGPQDRPTDRGRALREDPRMSDRHQDPDA